MSKRFDPHVAKALLAPHLVKLRTASYAELGEKARSGCVETFEAANKPRCLSDGGSFRWTGAPRRDVRVLGFVFTNLNGKINGAPDGRFVGE
jgi:hypothetical protein